MTYNRLIIKVRLLSQFCQEIYFSWRKRLATHLITPDDVYGARTRGFTAELVRLSWRVNPVLCAM